MKIETEAEYIQVRNIAACLFNLADDLVQIGSYKAGKCRNYAEWLAAQPKPNFIGRTDNNRKQNQN